MTKASVLTNGGKVCSMCGEWKPTSEFFKSKKAATGLKPRCKTCSSKAGKEYNLSERGKQLRRDWGKSEKGKLAAQRKSEREKAERLVRREERERLKAEALPRLPWHQTEKGKEYAKQQQKYYAETGKRKEIQKKYRETHREKLYCDSSTRRALKASATPSWNNIEKELIQFIYATAKLLTKTIGIKYEIDHIVPLISDKVCGLHCISNLQILPGEVNRRKSNKWWPDM